MVDLENATIRLYEEASLTEDLMDQDATMLLKWAEQQVADLVAQHGSDDEAFETAFSALRSVVKNMNRFVGQSAMSDEDKQAQRLENITQSAHEIGFEVAPTFGAQSLSRSPQSTTEMLQTMLNALQKTDTAGTAGGTGQPTGGFGQPSGGTAGSTATAGSTGMADGTPTSGQTADAGQFSAQTASDPASDPQSPRHQQNMTLQSSAPAESEPVSNTASQADAPDAVTDDRLVRVFTLRDHPHKSEPTQSGQDVTADTADTEDDAQDAKPGLASQASRLRDVLLNRHKTVEDSDTSHDDPQDESGQ